MENINPLISIIIPIYNVDKFLMKCLESCISQTYKNIEMILINDGSTDNSGNICDEYQKRDRRVKVVHKKNAGVSAARNYGINIAKGDWIIFVDADDYLSVDFVQYMLNLVKKSGASFGLSKKCYLSKEDKQEENECKILSPEEATALLLSQEVIVGCWNKIYNRQFLLSNNIKFSTNLFYGEGLEFITTVAQKANFVAVGNKRVYFYRKNNDNSATTKFKIEKHYNGEKAINIIKENLLLKSDLIDKQLKIHYTLLCLNAVKDIISNKLKKEFNQDYNRWISIIKENKKEILRYKEVTYTEKLKILLVCYFPNILVKLSSIKRKKLYKNSV